MSTPTQKSLKYLRSQGYHCVIVEHYNHHLKIRQDLLGFADILALGNRQTIAVQVTSKSNFSARWKKITGATVGEGEKGLKQWEKLRGGLYAAMRAGWRVQVHGWEKGSMKPRIEQVEPDDLVNLSKHPDGVDQKEYLDQLEIPF